MLRNDTGIESETVSVPPLSGLGDRRASVAEETRRYIEGRPSIRDCLRYDIVNLTALARRICAETGLESQEAVEIACRRYRRQMQGQPSQEDQLRAVVRASHIEVHTHVAVVTVKGDLEFIGRLIMSPERLLSRRDRLIELFQGSSYGTVLCEEEVLGTVLNLIPQSAILNVRRRLSSVSVRSPAEVLVTPRVLGFLAEALGRAGINCVEMMSVFTDTLFVLRSEEAVRAFEILSDLGRTVDFPEALDTPAPAGSAALLAPSPETRGTSTGRPRASPYQPPRRGSPH
jgi:hypothetical protein